MRYADRGAAAAYALKRIGSKARISLAAFAILAAFAAALGSCALPDIRVGTPDLAALADGAYRGSYDGGMVKAEVEVEVAGGAIRAIRILRHECGTGKPAEAIVDEVVARQSLSVDAVSGSTYSSLVILKAIELALSSAI